MPVPETYVGKLMAPLLFVGYLGGTVSWQHHYQKMYSCGLIITFVFSYIYLSYGKSRPVFGHFTFLVIFTDQIAGLFLVLSGVSSIIVVFYKKSKNLSSIMKHFDLFDYNIGIPVKVQRFHFWALIIFANVEVIGIFIADSWIWLDSLGLEMYHYYFARNIMIYFMEMRKLLVYWLTVETCSRFQITIVHLENIFKLDYQKGIYFHNQAKLLKKLKRISNLHNSLCDTTVLLSETYGLTIAFDVLLAISLSLEYSILMITLTVVKSKSLTLHYGMDLMSICCLWIADSFVKVFLLALSGERISRNANDIIPICYRILHQLDSNLVLESHLLKKELRMLIKQVTQRKPCLDAAGFFVVNFNMLGFVITSFTSYIIVAIQFLLKDTK